MRLPQRAAQRTYLRNHLNAFASALNGANWRDPLLGWRPYIDEGAWIDHHLLNVVAFNVDALRLSAYFHKPRGGPLVFGPLWDFDRSLNSTDGRDANPRVWANSGGTDFFNYPWWNRLFRDPDFWQHWVDRYQDLRRGTLGTNHLFAAIDRWTDEVRPAQPREAARWPGFTTPRGSYQGEIDALKTWLSRRLHFMDTNFLAAAVMEPSAGRVAVGTSVRLNGPPGATVYYTLDGSDPRAPGGAVAAGARVYSQPLRIEGAGTVRARAYHAGHRNRTGSLAPPISTSWSGLTEARYGILPTPGPGTLRLTEIHYRPAAPDSRELAAIPGVTRGDFEFVELRSFGSEVVDLHGVRFTEGIAFDFSASAVSVLAPGERLVLVRHRAAFELRYGTVTNLAGVYSGALAAAGEVLAWEDAAGNRLGTTAFRPALFPATDGLGFSLVAADDGAGSIPGDEAWGWRPSARLGGSPGAPEPEGTGIPAVRIHEVLSHPGPGQRDGLELHHPGPGPADVGGWFLTDDPDQPRKFRIPDGTILPAGGYLWIDATQFGPGGNPGTPFGFNAAGEAAWLFAADATGNLLGYAHGFAFGAAPAGVSFGRETTCDGRELFVAQRRVTPGAPNPGPLRPSVVISEIHYHPPDIRLGVERLNDTAMEFLELTNTGDEPVRLFDPEVPQLTWRLRDAVDFVFPAAVVLPPGRSLLVVNFDPETNPQARARFTAAFGISLEVPLYGPYGGSLPNSAGRVELVRPDPPQGTVNPAPDTLRWVVVDAVGYEDRGSWGAEADGGGGSLQRLDLTALGDRPGAWRAAPPTPGQVAGAGADADGDGLPDAWEAAHCLDPDDPADAAEDADGDGASNAAEFLAGTHPQSADSVLAWSEVAADGGGVTLRFTAMPGREYVVEGRESVATGGWQTLWTVPARTEAGQVEVREAWTGQAGATRFYRIRLVRVPD